MSQKEIKKDMHLICPNCEHKNKVSLSSEINCKECQETLLGYTYKQFIISTIAVVGLSGICGAMIDDTVNLNRASVKTEYKMMRTCINEYQDRDTCFCAVESMSGFIDAEKARFYRVDKLKNILSKRYNDCKN